METPSDLLPGGASESVRLNQTNCHNAPEIEEIWEQLLLRHPGRILNLLAGSSSGRHMPHEDVTSSQLATVGYGRKNSFRPLTTRWLNMTR